MGLFKKKDKYTLSRKDLAKFNGKSIQYAVERIDGQEKVLGKNGGIIILSDVIVVMCEAHEVFRCRIKGATMGELLSGNDVEIVGYDDYTGEKRFVTAHYSYYRK
ncbi:MAG: hypothetical protein LUG23_04080 [Oscillospiraceae bacterium]|nr:hypothetical protein [Oscillospiraceae bacterium]